jgi:hypothetical protein
MKFGELLEDKRREGPEDYAPYYVRCAPLPPASATRSPPAVPAGHPVFSKPPPPHARLRRKQPRGMCLWFGSPCWCTIQPGGWGV